MNQTYNEQMKVDMCKSKLEMCEHNLAMEHRKTYDTWWNRPANKDRPTIPTSLNIHAAKQIYMHSSKQQKTGSDLKYMKIEVKPWSSEANMWNLKTTESHQPHDKMGCRQYQKTLK